LNDWYDFSAPSWLIFLLFRLTAAVELAGVTSSKEIKRSLRVIMIQVGGFFSILRFSAPLRYNKDALNILHPENMSSRLKNIH